ncbi:hypothetical protein RJ641_015539 [Dillenia turbinata]|uniref:Uncharacterized protein n=1 Tax=Dillenia turbinata TaxID=194707 RepID=A0AAN8Z165_9MAGN
MDSTPPCHKLDPRSLIKSASRLVRLSSESDEIIPRFPHHHHPKNLPKPQMFCLFTSSNSSHFPLFVNRKSVPPIGLNRLPKSPSRSLGLTGGARADLI